MYTLVFSIFSTLLNTAETTYIIRAFKSWMAVVKVASYSGKFEANYKDDMKTMIDGDYNHPSVFLYSISNEVSEPAQPVIAVRPVNHPGVKAIKSAWRSSDGYRGWAWQGCEGNPAVLEIYGDGEKAELAETEIADQPVYIDLSICDSHGIAERNCDKKIKVSVEEGTLLAFGSAEPRAEESYVTGEFTTYYGRSQVIVLWENAGDIRITAECEGLKKK